MAKSVTQTCTHCRSGLKKGNLVQTKMCIDVPPGLKSKVKKTFLFTPQAPLEAKKPKKPFEFSFEVKSVASLNCKLSPGFKSTVREPHPPPKEE